MREPEEEIQITGGEEEGRKKKKRRRVKEEKTDEEASAAVESSREGLRDAAEIGLGLISENNDERRREQKKKKKKKKRRDVEGLRDAAEVGLGPISENNDEKKRKRKKKKRRDAEAAEGSKATAERVVEEGIKLAVANDEKEGKMKTKKKRKDEANTGKEDGVSSVMFVSPRGLDEGINAVGNREEERTDEGKHRVEARKSEDVVKERVELQETRERKKKDKSPRVGKNLESFEAGVLEHVSGNQEGRLESRMGVRLEEHRVQHGDGRSLKETKTKRKKRDRNSEDKESFSEQRTTKEQKPVAEDERIADEGSSHGSHDDKRRKKNLDEENSLGSGEINKKKKKAKDELTGLGKPITNNMSDGGLGTGNKLTMTAEETAGDDNHKVQSSSTTRDEKKTWKKKKNKDGTAEDMKVSIEENSNKEIAGENDQTMDIKKTYKISADEGTSSVRNLDDTNASTTAETKKKVKKVNFSSHVEVFPSTNDAESNGPSNEDGLVRGKRFSQEEDEMIKLTVLDYIVENHLGEDGLNMVLNCKSHPEVRTCWKEIGAALPWRPRQSVYWRAHTLFQRSMARKWEPEELDFVRRYYKEHGPKWKEMAELLGKHRIHVKDVWRRIKLTNGKKGHWSQEEYQALFDLVNMDLQLKAFEEKKTKHGMLRENISWGAISKKLSTRHDAACCLKWYGQLTSPMVTQGLWADTDDYHLIDELLKLDASCIEDVEWDSLLENKSGDLCLNRWKQMTRHIGGHRENSFMEQVELLATRYCPNMLQYRTRNPNKCDKNVDESENSPV